MLPTPLPLRKRTAGKDEPAARCAAIVVEQGIIYFQYIRLLVDFHAAHTVFICTFKPPVSSNVTYSNRVQTTCFLLIFN